MIWLWLFLAVSFGGIMGFGICALLSKNKQEPLDVTTVVCWITSRILPDDTMDEIVRRVYDGKRTIHKNPIRKKVAG